MQPNKWLYEVLPCTFSEIDEFCVKDAEWQRFRLTLKGVPTTKKLEMLQIRRLYRLRQDSTLPRRYQVQIDNYINALKRGGQLNMKLEVQK